ncbi:conserved hypothetical protein [Ricinus communis]|uniref:CCHC-type domain-containing protein n=1 Tax=Ricinus communis TaxID=3988 RepID=B9RRI0_RICCO|nr:conserved hypothetical protein [Ricinus communis]
MLEVVCYECNKPRHIKPNCPKLEKKSKRINKRRCWLHGVTVMNYQVMMRHLQGRDN